MDASPLACKSNIFDVVPAIDKQSNTDRGTQDLNCAEY